MLQKLLAALVFVISVWMLSTSWIEWQVRTKGVKKTAKVLKVERAIPTGWRRLFVRSDGSFDCDYLLTIALEGRTLTGVLCRSGMRIVKGKRVLRFREGDQIEVLFLEKYAKSPMVATSKARGGSVLAVWLWAFCALVTLLVFCFLLQG